MTSQTKPLTQYTTPSDCEFRITRVVKAPRHLVFEAWTDSKHVPHWMLGPPGWTMPVCQIDLRVGGKWWFVWRKADGSEMGMGGVYREISPPERLVSTEKWGPEWPETINTVQLAESKGETTITITVLYPSKEARDAALQMGMKEGMENTFQLLGKYLATMA